MTIKERVMQLLEVKGVAKENFFSDIGMSSANFRGAAKLTPLNSNAIANIFTVLPDVNLEWLITGKGDMFRSQQAQTTASSTALLEIIKDKDARIEKYIRENERLSMRVKQLESETPTTVSTSAKIGQYKGA